MAVIPKFTSEPRPVERRGSEYESTTAPTNGTHLKYSAGGSFIRVATEEQEARFKARPVAPMPNPSVARESGGDYPGMPEIDPDLLSRFSSDSSYCLMRWAFGQMLFSLTANRVLADFPRDWISHLAPAGANRLIMFEYPRPGDPEPHMKTLRLYDTTTGKEVMNYVIHLGMTLVFSLNGKYFTLCDGLGAGLFYTETGDWVKADPEP